MTLLRQPRSARGKMAGGFVLIEGALRMPLHRQHEMIRLSSFQCFDDAIVGAAGDDAQAVAVISPTD